MPWRVQRYGHSGALAAQFVGLEREITVDVSQNTMRVHDGFTPGGHESARADMGNVAAATTSTAGKMTAAQVVQLTDNTTNIGILQADVIAAQSTADTALTDAAQAQTTADGKIAKVAPATAGRLVALTAGGELTQDGKLAADIALLKAGTTALFVQAAAPDGWTQDAVLNDRVLRVVNTAGAGVGGSWTFSGVVADGTVLTLGQMPRHGHDYTRPNTPIAARAGGGDVTVITTSDDTTDQEGNDEAHGHTVSNDSAWRPSYVDAIVCVRD